MTAPSPEPLGAVSIALAVAVMMVWGSNFVVIAFGLEHLPPLFFAAVRFSFAFMPLAFFLKRPAVPWSNLAAFGLLIGVCQFGVLFIAMRADISPGLASLIVQTQVFFTILLGMLFHAERLRTAQILSMLVAAAGLAVIAFNANGSATPLGLAMVLFAALSWSAGNMVVRRAGRVSMLSYMVWSSLFPAPVLFALSFGIEGWPAIQRGLLDATLPTWLAVVWQSVGNTMFGYGLWGWLMARHGTAPVVPFALLVPIFGIGTSAIVLGEGLPVWKIIGSVLILVALGIGMWRRPAVLPAAEPG